MALVDFMDESSEMYVYMEKASEDDATTLKKTMKWYDKFIETSKKDANTVKEIQERIDCLETCIKNMKRGVQGLDTSGHIKYVLKDIIPFNSIWRLITKQDVYAGAGLLASEIAAILRVPGSGFLSMIIRGATYKTMLEGKIKKTEEAVDFLKKKKAEIEK